MSKTFDPADAREETVLLALLARAAAVFGWRAGLRQDPTAQAGMRTQVCIQLPTGQVAWNVRDDEKPMFAWMGEFPFADDGSMVSTRKKRVFAAVAPHEMQLKAVIADAALRWRRKLADHEFFSEPDTADEAKAHQALVASQKRRTDLIQMIDAIEVRNPFDVQDADDEEESPATADNGNGSGGNDEPDHPEDLG